MKTTELFKSFILVGLLGLLTSAMGQNVGIGTSNPGGKLTIVPATGGRGLEILSPSAGNTHFPWSNNWNYISGDGVIFRDASHTEKVRINLSSGNVGIGTNNPTGKLSIVPASGGNGIEVLSPSAGNTYLPYSNNWNYLSGDGVIFRNASGSEKARIDLGTGNVGIGTTTPDQKLEVSGTGAIFARVTSSNNNNPGIQFFRPGTGNRDYQILNEGGAYLRFSSTPNLGTTSLTHHLNIDGVNDQVEIPGKLGVGLTSPSHKITIQGTNDDVLRLIGAGSSGSGARLNFGDGDYVYLYEDADDDLTIYASGRTALMGGSVGVGTTSPSHKLTVSSPYSDNALRLIGPGSSGSGARLNFGNYDNVYLDEDSDDNLIVYANSRLRLNGNYDLELYTHGHRAVWIDDGNSNLYVKNSTSAVSTWFTSAGNEPAIVPRTKNWGYLGTSGNYWYKMYGADIYTEAGFLGWVLLDTYDDLELLNNIEADTVWDEKLQHHVMVMKPETFPEAITSQDTLEDGSLSDIFVSYKRLTGLLIGSARQLDKQTKERDRRLAARTEVIAQAVGVGFTESNTLTRTITDGGKQTTSYNEIIVPFTDSFKAQLKAGQEPVVYITPRSWYEKYMISSVDENGFTLKVKMDPSEKEFSFNWQATASVEITIENNTENLADVFYKEPIEITGDYPSYDHNPPKPNIESISSPKKEEDRYQKEPRKEGNEELVKPVKNKTPEVSTDIDTETGNH